VVQGGNFDIASSLDHYINNNVPAR
jgi:hypothetical protein